MSPKTVSCCNEENVTSVCSRGENLLQLKYTLIAPTGPTGLVYSHCLLWGQPSKIGRKWDSYFYLSWEQWHPPSWSSGHLELNFTLFYSIHLKPFILSTQILICLRKMIELLNGWKWLNQLWKVLLKSRLFYGCYCFFHVLMFFRPGYSPDFIVKNQLGTLWLQTQTWTKPKYIFKSRKLLPKVKVKVLFSSVSVKMKVATHYHVMFE